MRFSYFKYDSVIVINAILVHLHDASLLVVSKSDEDCVIIGAPNVINSS